MRKIIKTLLIIVLLHIINGVFYLTYYQYKTVEKISNCEKISAYEKYSILTLHTGLYTIALPYCPIAGYANFRMIANPKDTIYIHSNEWLSPKIMKRFKENKLGKVVWDGNKDYSFDSKEKNAAILLNYCYIDRKMIKGKPCYVAECKYTWEQPSKTKFDLGIITITIHEQLFYELEKCKILHPYVLICYYEI